MRASTWACLFWKAALGSAFWSQKIWKPPRWAVMFCSCWAKPPERPWSRCSRAAHSSSQRAGSVTSWLQDQKHSCRLAVGKPWCWKPQMPQIWRKS